MNKRYYSPRTKGLYNDKFHGKKKPTDCVEITEAQHNELKGQAVIWDGEKPVLATLSTDGQKAGKWLEIKNLRKAKRKEDLTYGAGNTPPIYQVDEYSLKSMEEAAVELVKAGDTSATIDWRDAGDNLQTLTGADLEGILTAYRGRKHLLSTASWNAQALLNASNDPASIDAAALYDAEIAKLS